MTRARNVSKLGNPAVFSVDTNNNVGINSTSPDVKLDVGGAVLVTGISTFENTTQSTSSTTGALIISGGVGIAKSLNVGGNLSVAGTITYDDVTNIDSVGIVTARTGLRVVGGGLTVTGVSTFFDDIDLQDDDKILIGTGDDLEIYHNGSASYIHDNGTGDLNLCMESGSKIVIQSGTGGNHIAEFKHEGAAELFHNGNKKLETSATGVTVTGTLAATAVTGDGSGLSGVGGQLDITSSLFI